MSVIAVDFVRRVREEYQMPKKQKAWEAASFTHTGNHRQNNEDRVFVGPGLYVVCDGLGGHQAGEVAAQMTVRMIARANPRDLDALTSTIEDANAAVFDRGRHDDSCRGMGTTVVAVLLVGGNAIVAHVGDSRAYAVRPEKDAKNVVLHQLTKDHELNGRLTDAIGCDRGVHVDVKTWEVLPGDVLLLCSDGLYRDVDNGRIARRLNSGESPKQIGQSLLSAALDGGGHDNISGVVIRV